LSTKAGITLLITPPDNLECIRGIRAFRRPISIFLLLIKELRESMNNPLCLKVLTKA
jgi:hypothetical protein